MGGLIFPFLKAVALIVVVIVLGAVFASIAHGYWSGIVALVLSVLWWLPVTMNDPEARFKQKNLVEYYRVGQLDFGDPAYWDYQTRRQAFEKKAWRRWWVGFLLLNTIPMAVEWVQKSYFA